MAVAPLALLLLVLAAATAAAKGRDWIRGDEGPVCDCGGQLTYAAGTGASREEACDDR